MKRDPLTDQQVIKDVVDDPSQTKAVDVAGEVPEKDPNLTIKWHLAFPLQN
jgi:hypothetical protein